MILVCYDQANIHPAFYSRTSNRVNEFRKFRALCALYGSLRLNNMQQRGLRETVPIQWRQSGWWRDSGAWSTRRLDAAADRAAAAALPRLLSERSLSACAVSPFFAAVRRLQSVAGEVACRAAAAVQNFGAKEGGRKKEHVYSIKEWYRCKEKCANFAAGSMVWLRHLLPLPRAGSPRSLK
jgi:hypothetical protein